MNKLCINSYLDEKQFSPKAFLRFIHENASLAIASAVTILLVYGVRLTTICFGIDTELHIAENRYINWMAIGRFGLVGLQKLWTNFWAGKELFNPYLAVLLACGFLFFATLTWCYVIDMFSDGSIKRSAYIPFAVVFISHQVWTEQVYFVLQSAECLFIVLLSPIAVYYLFYGSAKSSIKEIGFGFLLTVFCTSVYQGVLILIYCGIFALFVLFKEHTNLESKAYTRLCITLLVLMFASAGAYFAANKIVQLALHVRQSDYLVNQLGNDQNSALFTVVNLGVYVYKLVFAHCPPIAHIAEPIMAKTARTGWKAVEEIRTTSLMSNILLFPAVILFVMQILRNTKKSFLYVAAAFCVLLCVFALPIAGGGDAPLRSQYVLPFAIAFVLLYAASKMNGKVYQICIILFALCGARQTLVCSMLNYSDVMRYKADVRLSEEIAERIHSIGVSPEIPVFFYGVHHPQFSGNYIKGETCACSPFEWAGADDTVDSTYRGVAFMKTQGYNFSAVKADDEALIQRAREAAETMADFPLPNSVKNMGDVVVVRFSETLYQPKEK